MENLAHKIFEYIKEATSQNCKITKSKTMQIYQPGFLIKIKIPQYNAANLKYLINGAPNNIRLNIMSDE